MMSGNDHMIDLYYGAWYNKGGTLCLFPCEDHSDSYYESCWDRHI